MRRLLLTATVIWSFHVAYASGDRVGNGGDVVQCKTSSELLDFYEASEPLKDFGAKGYKEILDQVLENLKRLNPSQATQYSRRLQEIYQLIDFKSDVLLTDVDDSKHLFLPKDKDCKLLQIAIRRNVVSKVTKRFLVNEDLWKALSERSKAGLIMHEAVYEHFYKLGEDNSSKARILNAYLFSKKATTDSSEDYWGMIKSLKISIYK
ncbi:MAG TPA: hypothetical protein VF412_20005 [Bdellovibrio sp.]|uniref:hypothetical protein n=1 Tax=Bdellovibrio sp. TaxID=28201 RepID=UPI002EEBC3C5